MSLKSALRRRAVGALLSDRRQSGRRWAAEMKRRVSGKAHVVSAFLQLDDPYSYLLSLYLPSVAEAYEVEIRPLLMQSLGEDYTPHAALLAEYAAADCRLLAQELGVAFLDKGDTPVVEHRRDLTEWLAGEQDGDDFAALFYAALAAYWRGDTAGVERLIAAQRPSGKSAAVIEANQARLESLGHYSAAMLYYGKEWYWGVDRLSHLVERFEQLGLRHVGETSREFAAIGQARQLNLPATVPDAAKSLPPVEFFFSFRSPYSYLAMQRAFDIVDAYGIRLELRPILPMVSRGVPLPRHKLLYILADAMREARAHGVGFETFCDPLGAGVERCLATFTYALDEHRERPFMLAAGEAIWEQGVDLATDKGLRSVTERVGLFWPDVDSALRRDDWRHTVEDNAETLADMGLWGVPAFRFGEQVFWGQDRLWLLARQIEDRCHDGEGIMV